MEPEVVLKSLTPRELRVLLERAWRELSGAQRISILPTTPQQQRRLGPDQIAQVAHEVNRAYCEALGDETQPAWRDAPEWQQRSALNGVAFHLANPDAFASASHDAWLKEKLSDGWSYGEVKDVQAKRHPCCVQYEDLPVEQRAKDYLFRGVVRALKDLEVV